LADLHFVVQPPQRSVVLSAVSQPLAGFWSQSPQPGKQLAIVHVPPSHLGVALARVHLAVQLPQWAVELSGVSQPVLSLPSQLPQPELHRVHLQSTCEYVLQLASGAHVIWVQPPEPSAVQPGLHAWQLQPSRATVLQLVRSMVHLQDEPLEAVVKYCLHLLHAQMPFA
jgi:hypothetical protein